MAQFLNDLMRWCRVEDVVLNRHILIVELMNQAERWHTLGAIAIPSLAETLCDSLGDLVSVIPIEAKKDKPLTVGYLQPSRPAI